MNNEPSEFELKVRELIEQGKFEEEFRKVIKETNEDRRDTIRTNFYITLHRITQDIRNSEYKKRFDDEKHEIDLIQFNNDIAEITKQFDNAMVYIRNYKIEKNIINNPESEATIIRKNPVHQTYNGY